MKIRIKPIFILFYLSLTLIQPAFTQTELNPNPELLKNSQGTDSVTPQLDQSQMHLSAPNFINKPFLAPPVYSEFLSPSPQITSLNLNFNLGDQTFQWDGGGVIGTSNFEVNPGLNAVECASLGIKQSFGPLSITALGSADKIGYFNGVSTLYGISGALNYGFSDQISLTIYGSFYNQNLFLSPAMMPFIPSNNFGGFLSLKVTDKWGVDVGAKARYNSWTHRYGFSPTVMPYYEISPGNKLGIDIGEILYRALENRNDFKVYPSNATIGPPIYMGPPPVRPHD